MMPINNPASLPLVNNAAGAVLNENQRLINQWETWARASEPGSGEMRDIALLRLKECLEFNNKMLDLSALNLTQLPETLPASLEYLVADNNKLTQLPDPLPDSLQILLVSKNQLTRLPEPLPASLEYLVADNNKLTQLPDPLPDSLQMLFVLKNQLTRLPEPLPDSLVELNVRDNQITGLLNPLPDSLIKLNASNNQITGLPAPLPNSLVDLYASNNQITDLPDPLPGTLKRLAIGYNQLTRLPEPLPDSLVALYASNNQITDLPAPLPGTLKRLVIAYNQLTQLPARLPDSLETLNVNNNRIAALPAELPGRLRSVHIENNLSPGLSADVRRLLNSRNLTYSLLPPDSLIRQIASWTSETAGWQPIEQESHAGAFAHFLERLNSGKNSQNAELRERLQGWLAYLKQQENRELRERTFLIADEATGSCVDRASFYFNQMYVQMIEHQLIKSAPSLNDLWLTNLGLFRLAELEKVAARQVQARRLVSPGFDEEIEMYLAYQYKLRDKLSLPVYSELQFEEIASLSEQDVQRGEEEVLLAEKAGFIRYLVTESASWAQRLSAWDRKQKDALDEEYLSEIGSEIFARAVADELTALGLPADDSDGQRAVSGRRAQELWYQKRYRFSRAFLAAHQGLSLLDNFAHPGAE